MSERIEKNGIRGWVGDYVSLSVFLRQDPPDGVGRLLRTGGFSSVCSLVRKRLKERLKESLKEVHLHGLEDTILVEVRAEELEAAAVLCREVLEEVIRGKVKTEDEEKLKVEL
jgi:hypothetical protein